MSPWDRQAIVPSTSSVSSPGTEVQRCSQSPEMLRGSTIALSVTSAAWLRVTAISCSTSDGSVRLQKVRTSTSAVVPSDSNSNRLVDVTREHGTAAHLIDKAAEVEEGWLEGVETLGITSGASAPEELVAELVEMFRARGTEDVAELRAIDEDVRFMLPKQIRTELAAAAG